MTQVSPTTEHPEAAPNTGGHRGHPSAGGYIKIAIILAVITAIEVTIYYIPALKPILPPILIALSITKFALVALFFMHLLFDSRFFSVIFIVGIMIALFVFLIFLTMIRVFFT
jgi:cytochrome c oxidase subunit IV